MVEITCPHCRFSKEVPENRVPAAVNRVRCPRCREQFQFRREERGVDPSEVSRGGFPGEITGSAVPWENRAELGLWRGIYRTCRVVLFAPRRLFRSMTVGGGLGEPLAFGLLVGSAGAMMSVFWQFALFAAGVSALQDSPVGRLAAGVVFVGVLIFVPIFVLISLMVYSAFLHLVLLMVRGGRQGFEATFRVVSYSQAAHLWALLPLIGGWVAAVWSLAVQIIGLREIHESSYARVIAAFLIPAAAAVLLVVAAVVGLFALAGGGAG